MSEERRLKVAFAGTGNICMQHAAAIRTAMFKADITALFNRSEQRLQDFPEAFSRKYGLTLSDNEECALFTDFDSMLKSGLFDVLYITVPHMQHVDFALKAAELGIPCMIEKPLDISLYKAKLLKETAERTGTIMSVVAQSRFYPPAERIRKIIEDGEDPVTGKVTVMAWRDENYYKSSPWRGSWEYEGGGVLVNQSVHELDLLCYFLGEPESVYGIWRNVNHPYIETDDTAQALVTFKSGAVADIAVSNSVNPAYRNQVMVSCRSGATFSMITHEGTEENAGLAAYDFVPYNDVFTSVSETDRKSQHDLEVRKKDPFSLKYADSFCPYFAAQFDNFAEAVLHDDPSVLRSDLNTATGCMEIFNGIYLSHKLGRPVFVHELYE